VSLWRLLSGLSYSYGALLTAIHVLWCPLSEHSCFLLWDPLNGRPRPEMFSQQTFLSLCCPLNGLPRAYGNQLKIHSCFTKYTHASRNVLSTNHFRPYGILSPCRGATLVGAGGGPGSVPGSLPHGPADRATGGAYVCQMTRIRPWHNAPARAPPGSTSANVPRPGTHTCIPPHNDYGLLRVSNGLRILSNGESPC